MTSVGNGVIWAGLTVSITVPHPHRTAQVRKNITNKNIKKYTQEMAEDPLNLDPKQTNC